MNLNNKNIISTGIDIVQIPRIENLFAKYGDKFLNKICTKDEIIIIKNYKTHKKQSTKLAMRFSAKEAIVKALGTGFINGIWFTDIEIKKNKLGKPYPILYNKANEKLQELIKDNNASLHISMSDDYPIVITHAIIG